MAKIIVVGLGPGELKLMTLETYDLLMSGKRVFLRTALHPCVVELKQKGVVYEAFDSVYETCEDFQQVYEQIASRLVQEAKQEDLVYAVPGHPRVAEQSVRTLLARASEHGIPVEVRTAVSFLDPLFILLSMDPVDGINVIDGSMELDKPAYKRWNIVCQIYDRMLASERKLDLMNYYPDDFPVYVVEAAGVAGVEKAVKLPLYELDRGDWFNHLTCLVIPPLDSVQQPPNWDRLVEVMARLRKPDGCPWDREQTHLSLRPYLIEETYEVLDALDQGDMYKLCEELGDLLLQIVFHAQLAQERQEFTIDDVIQGIVEKLIRRHPHVFGHVALESAGEVVENWEKIKEKESGGRVSVFDGLTAGLPALMYARKVQSRAAKVGFDWPDLTGPADKVREELAELLAAASDEQRAEELGDLLFAVVNLSRFFDVDPETALRGTVSKFMQRFRFIEQQCSSQGLRLDRMKLDEMDRLWNLAKNNEKSGKLVQY